MNILKYIFIFFVAIIPIIAKSQDYCEFIEQIQSYQNSVGITHSEDYDIINSYTFDIQTYLSFFTDIEFEQGYNIGVYYFDNFLDGNPYIYSLKDNQRLPEKNIDSLYYVLNEREIRAKNHIIPKATNIGFLQYLFFSEFGEQFALKWHANYKKKYVVCSKEELNRIVDELIKYNQIDNDSIEGEFPLFMVDINELNEFAKISPAIEIESTNEYYTIAWMEYRTFSGIYQCKYEIQRQIPYDIKLINEERLLEITPGFIF